jgi:hypothetical protein
MADVLVTCITKPHPSSLHEHITELGNPRANWKWAREKVIASIDAKETPFTRSTRAPGNAPTSALCVPPIGPPT